MVVDCDIDVIDRGQLPGAPGRGRQGWRPMISSPRCGCSRPSQGCGLIDLTEWDPPLDSTDLSALTAPAGLPNAWPVRTALKLDTNPWAGGSPDLDQSWTPSPSQGSIVLMRQTALAVAPRSPSLCRRLSQGEDLR
jgi:hypothetical protein